MRIFVNNVDGFLAGAICADLHKLSHHITGTRKGLVDDLIPPFVRKRLVPRVEVRRLLKAVGSSDVVVYDLHDADLEELELVLRTLYASHISQSMIFILITSVGVWSRTQREFETIPAQSVEAGDEAAVSEEVAPPVSGTGDGEDGSVAAGEDSGPPPMRRPMPLKSEDYRRRIPAPKFQEWKSIETMTLALKEKPGVRPYVICAGIPYGNGEDAFLGLFKACWQTRPTLRVIGNGENSIPLVHARDCARLVRLLIQSQPSLDYHLAVDRCIPTQRELIEAVAREFGIPYEIQSVGIGSAVLAELADILTLDLRMLPSEVMNVPWVEPSSNEGAGEGENDTTPQEEETAATEPEPLPFRWWCEQGLVANIGKVADEFARWRRLDPVRIIIVGPPGCYPGRLGALVATRLNLPLVNIEEQVEELTDQQSPLGQQLRDSAAQIEAALANPKSQGPFVMPSALMMQVMERAIDTKPTKYRGFVMCGFPQNAEEAVEFFMEDPPPASREDDDASPTDAGAAEQPQKVLKASVAPDLVVVINSSDEACLARVQEIGKIPVNEFGKQVDKWNKDNPSDGPNLQDGIRQHFQMEPFVVSVDEADLEIVARQVSAQLESVRTVYNFLLPPKDDDADKNACKEETETVKDEETLRREAEEKKRQKEAEERLEAIKRDEYQRLEKRSEGLRQYLMGLVVPSLTTGLIEVCREVPEDPIGYLSEYLSVYSQVTRARGRKAARRKEAQSDL
eukprot:TRINITY_DN12777_c0_g1_i1.p1 TRINITY_DN12777_c0_g1~~TRINITY_DN12777_c0_g1_i1.p1  ORF type:complete len:739 (+),score=124.46 TRINITY_DN12777_c0_g1_i1:125-2341(+)